MSNKIDYIADKQHDAILNAWSCDMGSKPNITTPISIVSYISKKCNIKYLQWLVNQYIQKSILFEDLDFIMDDLKLFEKIKPQLQNKDINQFKSIFELRYICEHYKHELSVISNRQKEKLIKHQGVTLFYKDELITVLDVITKDAAILYGAGSKWCTTIVDKEYFERYKSVGSIFIVLTYDNRKFQIHFESDQIKNELNASVYPSKLVLKYPSLAVAFNDYAIRFNIFPWILNPTYEQCVTAIAADVNNFMLIRDPSNNICKYAVSKNGCMLKYVKQQTTDICITAIQQTQYAKQFVNIKTPELTRFLLQQKHSINQVLSSYINRRNKPM